MGFRLPKTKGMLRREAARWLARLQSGREPDIKLKFQQWHDRHPRHAEAVERVRRSYDQAGLLRHSPIVSSGLHQPEVRKTEWKPLPALAAAAAVVLAVPIGALMVGAISPFGRANAMMLMTKVGEIRQVELADGSKVTLDTATKVDVEVGRSRRSAHLRYGRARFHVAQAITPFVVEAAGTTVTANEGVIDVEQIDGQGRVQVLAGAADVRGSQRGQPPTLALRAGEAVTMSSDGVEQKTALARAPDWTKGMLQFDATPLVEAVALANRYSEHHIILAGDLNTLRVTGAFRAGDTTGLAKALAAAFGLSLQQRTDGNLFLARSASSDLQNKKGG